MNVLTLGSRVIGAGAGVGVHRRLPRRDVQRRAAPPATAGQGPRDRGQRDSRAALGRLGVRPRPADPRSRGLVGRGRRGLPGADRRGQSPDQRRRRPRGRRARAGPRLVRSAGPRRDRRAAPRRPVHDQGLARHRGARHDGRHDRLEGPRAGSRRHRRRPAAGGRRDPARQDEHARVHLVERDRQRRLRPDVEPVRPRRARPAAAPAARRRSSPRAASPFDIGSDTGDSIRQPSHVVRRRRDQADAGPGAADRPLARLRGDRRRRSSSSDPIARRVDDLALVLPIIAGPDGIDPHVAAGPARGPGPASTSASLRVIAFTDNGVHTPTPETIAAVEAAVAAVAATGATVSWDVPPDIADAADTWDRLIRADGHAWLRRLITAAGTPGRRHVRDAVLDRPRRGPARRRRADRPRRARRSRPLADARAGSRPT